jgi:hypothetical protein
MGKVWSIMTWENEFPLPDYNGGPADKAREFAEVARVKANMKRLDDLANLRSHLRNWVSDESEVTQAAAFLYDIGYRQVRAGNV